MRRSILATVVAVLALAAITAQAVAPPAVVTLTVPSNRFFAGGVSYIKWSTTTGANVGGAKLTVTCGNAGIIDPAVNHVCLNTGLNNDFSGYIPVTGNTLNPQNNYTSNCTGTISGLEAGLFDPVVKTTEMIQIFPRTAVPVVTPSTTLAAVKTVSLLGSVDVTFSPQSAPILPDGDVTVYLICTDLIGTAYTYHRTWSANKNDTLYFNGVGPFNNIGNVMCTWSLGFLGDPSQESNLNGLVVLPSPIYLTVVPGNTLTVTGVPVPVSVGNTTADKVTNFTVTINNPIPSSNQLASIIVGIKCPLTSGASGVQTAGASVYVSGGTGTAADNTGSNPGSYATANFTYANGAVPATFTISVPALPIGAGANVACSVQTISSSGDQSISWAYPSTISGGFNFFVGVVQTWSQTNQNTTLPLTIGTGSIDAGKILISLAPTSTFIDQSVTLTPVCTQSGVGGSVDVSLSVGAPALGVAFTSAQPNNTWTFAANLLTPGLVTCTYTVSGPDAAHFKAPPTFTVSVIDRLSLTVSSTPKNYDLANNTQAGINVTVTNPQADSRQLTVALSCTAGYKAPFATVNVTAFTTASNVTVGIAPAVVSPSTPVGAKATFADGNMNTVAGAAATFNIAFDQLQMYDGQLITCTWAGLAGDSTTYGNLYYKSLGGAFSFYVGTKVAITTALVGGNTTTLTVGDVIPVYLNASVPAIINAQSNGLRVEATCTYCPNTGSGSLNSSVTSTDTFLNWLNPTLPFPSNTSGDHFVFTALTAGSVKCSFSVPAATSLYDFYHFTAPADITFTINPKPAPAPLNQFTITGQSPLISSVSGITVPSSVGSAFGTAVSVVAPLVNTTTSVYLNVSIPTGAEVSLKLTCTEKLSGATINVAPYGGEPQPASLRRRLLAPAGAPGTLYFKNGTTTPGSFVISNDAPINYAGFIITCTFETGGADSAKWVNPGTFDYFIGTVRPLIFSTNSTVAQLYPGDIAPTLTLSTDLAALFDTPNEGLTVNVLCAIGGSTTAITLTSQGATLSQGLTGYAITFPLTATSYSFNVSSNAAGTVVCTVTGPITSANGVDYRHFSLATQSKSFVYLAVPSFTFTGEALNLPNTADLDAQKNLPGTQNQTKIYVQLTGANGVVARPGATAKVTLNCYIQRASTDAPTTNDYVLPVSFNTSFLFTNITANTFQQEFNVTLPYSVDQMLHLGEQIRCVPSYEFTPSLAFTPSTIQTIYFTVGTRGTFTPSAPTMYAYNLASFNPSGSGSQYTTVPSYTITLTPSACNGNGRYAVRATCTGGATLTFFDDAPSEDNKPYTGVFTPPQSLTGASYDCTFNQYRQWNTAYSTPTKTTFTTVTPGQIVVTGNVQTISNAGAATSATVGLSSAAPAGGVTVVVTCIGQQYPTQQLTIVQKRFYFFEGTSAAVPFTLQATGSKFTYTECKAETEYLSYNSGELYSTKNYLAYTANQWIVNQKRQLTVSDLTNPSCGLGTVTLTLSTVNGQASADAFTVTAVCGQNGVVGGQLIGTASFTAGQLSTTLQYQSPRQSMSDLCQFTLAMTAEDQAVTVTTPINKYFVTGTVAGFTVTPPASLNVAVGTNSTFTIAPSVAPATEVDVNVFLGPTPLTVLAFTSSASGAKSFSVPAPQIPAGQQFGQVVVSFTTSGANAGSYSGIQSYTITSAGSNTLALTMSNVTNIQQNSVVTFTVTPSAAIQINVDVTVACTGSPALSTGSFSQTLNFKAPQTGQQTASLNIGTAAVNGNVVSCQITAAGPGAGFTTFTGNANPSFDFYPPNYTGPHFSSSSSGTNGNSSSSSGNNNGTSSSSSSSGTNPGSSSSSSTGNTNSSSSSSSSGTNNGSSSTGPCTTDCSAISIASVPSMLMYAGMILLSLLVSRQ